MNQGIRNANDGISMAQTGEGALDEVNNMLQRMRELAVQSANGTYSTTDAANITAEQDALSAQIGSIITNTAFNGKNLFSTASNTVSVQAGANTADAISVDFTELDAGTTKAGRDTRQLVKLIQRDALSLGEHARTLSSKLNFLLDATLGLINLEQNQIIKIFSVAAVVFLPPTLVASSYGMNFEFMPELKWSFGYPGAIIFMLLAGLAPYLYFKRRNWL
jgi:magnesium/cobalt transport protein CorA